MRYNNKDLILQVNLKSLCNLSCDYCVLPDGSKNQKSSTKQLIENTKLLIKKVKEEEFNIKLFSIFGAEPLIVEPKIVASVLNEISDAFPNAFIKIQTNGTLATAKYIKSFLEVYRYKNKLTVGFSIDGVKTLHDKHRGNSYDLIMKNFKWIKENTNIFTTCICTTNLEHFQSKEYEQELSNFILDMKKQDTEVMISFADFRPKGLGESNIGLPEYSELFSDFLIKNELITNCAKLFNDSYCYRFGSMCQKVLFDLNNGDVYTCEKTFIPNQVIGNWIENSIESTMETRCNQSCKTSISSKCFDCEFEAWCRGGCFIKRDKDGLVSACHTTKKVLTHIKENITPDWNHYLMTNRKVFIKDNNPLFTKVVSSIQNKLKRK